MVDSLPDVTCSATPVFRTIRSRLSSSNGSLSPECRNASSESLSYICLCDLPLNNHCLSSQLSKNKEIQEFIESHWSYFCKYKNKKNLSQSKDSTNSELLSRRTHYSLDREPQEAEETYLSSAVFQDQTDDGFKRPRAVASTSSVNSYKTLPICEKISLHFTSCTLELTSELKLCLKGLVKGLNNVVRSDPVVCRLNCWTVASANSIYVINGHLDTSGLPLYIENKFCKGFPKDWDVVLDKWIDFVQQDQPHDFCWPNENLVDSSIPVVDSSPTLKDQYITHNSCNDSKKTKCTGVYDKSPRNIFDQISNCSPRGVQLNVSSLIDTPAIPTDSANLRRRSAILRSSDIGQECNLQLTIPDDFSHKSKTCIQNSTCTESNQNRSTHLGPSSFSSLDQLLYQSPQTLSPHKNTQQESSQFGSEEVPPHNSQNSSQEKVASGNQSEDDFHMPQSSFHSAKKKLFLQKTSSQIHKQVESSSQHISKDQNLNCIKSTSNHEPKKLPYPACTPVLLSEDDLHPSPLIDSSEFSKKPTTDTSVKSGNVNKEFTGVIYKETSLPKSHLPKHQSMTSSVQIFGNQLLNHDISTSFKHQAVLSSGVRSCVMNKMRLCKTNTYPVVRLQNISGVTHCKVTKDMKPELNLENWTPVLVRSSPLMLVLEGTLQCSPDPLKTTYHRTNPVLKRLDRSLVCTSDNIVYQLVGPPVNVNNSVPKTVLIQFTRGSVAWGLPRLWLKMLKEWDNILNEEERKKCEQMKSSRETSMYEFGMKENYVKGRAMTTHYQNIASKINDIDNVPLLQRMMNECESNMTNDKKLCCSVEEVASVKAENRLLKEANVKVSHNHNNGITSKTCKIWESLIGKEVRLKNSLQHESSSLFPQRNKEEVKENSQHISRLPGSFRRSNKRFSSGSQKSRENHKEITQCISPVAGYFTSSEKGLLGRITQKDKENFEEESRDTARSHSVHSRKSKGHGPLAQVKHKVQSHGEASLGSNRKHPMTLRSGKENVQPNLPAFHKSNKGTNLLDSKDSKKYEFQLSDSSPSPICHRKNIKMSSSQTHVDRKKDEEHSLCFSSSSSSSSSPVHRRSYKVFQRTRQKLVDNSKGLITQENREHSDVQSKNSSPLRTLHRKNNTRSTLRDQRGGKEYVLESDDSSPSLICSRKSSKMSSSLIQRDRKEDKKRLCSYSLPVTKKSCKVFQRGRQKHTEQLQGSFPKTQKSREHTDVQLGNSLPSPVLHGPSSNMSNSESHKSRDKYENESQDSSPSTSYKIKHKVSNSRVLRGSKKCKEQLLNSSSLLSKSLCSKSDKEFGNTVGYKKPVNSSCSQTVCPVSSMKRTVKQLSKLPSKMSHEKNESVSQAKIQQMPTSELFLKQLSKLPSKMPHEKNESVSQAKIQQMPTSELFLKQLSKLPSKMPHEKNESVSQAKIQQMPTSELFGKPKTLKQRQKQQDALMQLHSEVSNMNVNDIFSDPAYQHLDCMPSDCAPKITNWNKQIQTALKSTDSTSILSGHSTPPSKYLLAEYNQLLSVTPKRISSPLLEKPLYRRNDVLSHIHRVMNAPRKRRKSQEESLPDVASLMPSQDPHVNAVMDALVSNKPMTGTVFDVEYHWASDGESSFENTVYSEI